MAHPGQGRCVGAQPGGELLDPGGRPGDLALDVAVDVGHPAVQAEGARGAVDEGPEADALDDAVHPEVARAHDRSSAAISCATASTSSGTAAATAGVRPVPNSLSAPSTA